MTQIGKHASMLHGEGDPAEVTTSTTGAHISHS